MIVGYYVITHKVTKEFYIGSSNHVERRLWRHRNELERGVHVNRRLQQAFTHWDDFYVYVMETHDLEEAREEEQSLLDWHLGTPWCCNASASSTNGLAGVRGIVSRETRIHNLRKAIEQNRGRPLSDSHRAKIGDGNRGKVRTDELREHFSKVHSGRAHTDEAKRKISEGNIGKTRTDEHKRIISAVKSRPVSIEGVIYPSLKTASKAMNISDVTMRKRLNDGVNYPTWVYL